MEIERLSASSYTIPTDRPEADGTLEWNKTIIIVVEAHAGGTTGIGYTYTHSAAARIIHESLAEHVIGKSPMDIDGVWQAMLRSVRNIGRPGLVSCAIAAVDSALWDLKARLLNVPLTALLGTVRSGIPVYGSGGFTSYSIDELQSQLGGWSERGISMVKMKVGAQPSDDPERVRRARDAIGEKCRLFVDANGAYERKQALHLAESFARANVTWFEEPVSSDDLDGLRLLRDQAPAVMDIAAGEYGYDLFYFSRMLSAGAVDVLQADATRCGGLTGFIKAAALCETRSLPISAHTAPMLHMHLGCALEPCIHIEYFHDHVRIEKMLFDGFIEPIQGMLIPDRSRPGMGLEFKHADARKFQN